MSNLSTSALPSLSLEAEEPRDSAPRNSPGNTSSLRCTVNEFLPLLPKPIRLFLPLFYVFYILTVCCDTYVHWIFNWLFY